MSGWTEVCLIKAAYMKGTAQLQNNNPVEALRSFQSATPWMDDHREKVLEHTQLSYWSEQLLAQVARSASKNVSFRKGEAALSIDLAFRAFQHWALLAAKSKGSSPTAFGNSKSHVSKISVWKAYYEFASAILQHGIDYPSTGDISPRLRQSREIRWIETSYENELLRVTRFPDAQDSNAIIEDWVEQVIRNWEVLCGPHWHDAELGEGGRNSVGRNVLDILYRAATKTFHSTLILRRLFQVHKSLTDFDLAYKALDTYIELVERARARAEKSKKPESAQEDDETVLRTLSEGIEGLCSFGFREEAEKAYELSVKLEDWLKGLLPRQSHLGLVNGHVGDSDNEAMIAKKPVDPKALERVYRAIGIGQAHWAKWTPVEEERSDLRTDAISNLTQAVAQNRGKDHPFESIYALALLLAETQDINKAIEHVKKALAMDRSITQPNSNLAIDWKLIPLWHLLALLLTARQEFETARRTCSAPFEQFPLNALFGGGKPKASAHLSPRKERFAEPSERGLVDEMECRELERIIEIRMTELALKEVLEGPEEAVNTSNELLSLLSRLFARFGVATERVGSKEVGPPKSSASTVKSLRGTFFGRRKQAQSHLSEDEKVNGVSTTVDSETPRQSTQASSAPQIQVTDADDKKHNHGSHHFRHFDHSEGEGHASHKLHRREGSITRIIRQHSKERKSRQDGTHTSSQNESFQTTRESLEREQSRGRDRTSLSAKEAAPKSSTTQFQGVNPFDTLPPAIALDQTQNPSAEVKQPLPKIEHNQPHEKLPPPVGHKSQPPEQDARLPLGHPKTPSTQPLPRFEIAASQKHALVILIKIWLLIAGVYRRALMFDDSREASNEAEAAARRVETLVATQESSSRAFANAGWGGGKSSDEVWADVEAERAALAVAEGETSQAFKHYEEALMYWPDHVKATVGLSNMLLDIYDHKPPAQAEMEPQEELAKQKAEKVRKQYSLPITELSNGVAVEGGSHTGQTDEELRKTPENLNRLAARDRAYGLLSGLTKLGTAWDDVEAWFALARAQEASGEIDKARQSLWWCIELEDRRPIRHWKNITGNGYVL